VRTSLPAVAALALAAAAPAAAVDPFEIQVYGPDLNEPGQFSAELHLNFTFQGSSVPAYPGQVPALHSGHYTLEPAIGVTEWLELGAYLQTLSAPGFGYRWGGFKLRAKMIVPQRLTGQFFVGLNVEVGRVPSWVEDAAWGTEFRPILGWSDGLFLVDVNPILGCALDGPDAFRVDFSPAAKVAVNTQLGFSVGVEYYGELGYLSGIYPASQQQHLLFAVLDLVAPRGKPDFDWELNLGVGFGLTSATDQQLIVKAIVGRAF
jgi:hypothetical protein